MNGDVTILRISQETNFGYHGRSQTYTKRGGLRTTLNQGLHHHNSPTGIPSTKIQYHPPTEYLYNYGRESSLKMESVLTLARLLSPYNFSQIEGIKERERRRERNTRKTYVDKGKVKGCTQLRPPLVSPPGQDLKGWRSQYVVYLKKTNI